MTDWQEAYYDLVNKVECECVQQGDLVPIWDQFKRMSLTIQKLQGNQAALEAELAKLKALAEAVQADAAPVVWQQREKYPQAPGAIPQWRECSRSEAVGHFKKRPDCEYRPLYAHPPVADLAQLRAELEAANEVVAEQLEIRQRNEAELAKYKALAETLAGALEEAAAAIRAEKDKT